MGDLLTRLDYLFALRFLELVDEIRVEGVPQELQFLANMRVLPRFPKRVVDATVSDMLRRIAAHTKDWGPDRIARADSVLSKAGAPTLSDSRDRSFRQRGAPRVC